MRFLYLMRYLASAVLLLTTACGRLSSAQEAPSSFSCTGAFESLALHPIFAAASERIRKAQNPYETAYFLSPPAPGQSLRSVRDLLEFENILRNHHPHSRVERALNHWVTSPDHALYLFQHLDEFSHDGPKIMEYLLRKNPHFAEAVPSRDSFTNLVTVSFEGETQRPQLAEYYRPTSIPEKVWLKNDPQENLKKLIEVAQAEGYRANNIETLTPTQLKPPSLGGFTMETLSTPENFIGEVRNPSYDIRLDRIFEDMKSAKAKMRDMTFHVHLVSEFPKEYEAYSLFADWVHSLNEFTYFKGLEEGLHRNDMTQFPRRSQLIPDLETWKKISAEKTFYKFLSAAIRGAIYGPSSRLGYRKLGIELRDITKSLDELKKIAQQTRKSLANRVWENFKRPEGLTTLDEALHTHRTELNEKARQELLQAGINPRLATLFLKNDSNFKIPFFNFEKGRYFDYATGNVFRPTTARAVKIIQARKKFIQDLLQLDRELIASEEKEGPIDPEIVTHLLQITLVDWARAVRLSEFFSGF